MADEAKTTISAWCISIREKRIAEDEEHRPRLKIAKELETLKAENKYLRDDLRQKEIVLQRYEAELRRYRAEPF